MNLLAIDTSNGYLSLAVAASCGKFEFYSSSMPNSQAETICNRVEKMLSNLGMSLADVSHFGINMGPGSFTGCRISVSYLIGLLAFDDVAKVIEVDTFEVARCNLFLENVTKDKLLYLREFIASSGNMNIDFLKSPIALQADYLGYFFKPNFYSQGTYLSFKDSNDAICNDEFFFAEQSIAGKFAQKCNATPISVNAKFLPHGLMLACLRKFFCNNGDVNSGILIPKYLRTSF